MAIVKVISHGKNMTATRKIISYVLDENKTSPELCGTLGDFENNEISPKTVLQDFQRVRELFGKGRNGSRTYIHGTVSWAPGEVTLEEAASFAREYLPQIYSNHQVLYAVHQDTDHTHFHFVVNPVCYLDGSMTHWSKEDLKEAKDLCNEMCQRRGWQLAQKGHHYDGTPFDDGEITAWDKNKYHQIISATAKSYMVDAVLAIQDCVSQVRTREEFCAVMEHEYGWKVKWEDQKKHITFINSDGHKVRGSNLSKTFHLDISKEGLLRDIERSNRGEKEETNTAGITGNCPESATGNCTTEEGKWDAARPTSNSYGGTAAKCTDYSQSETANRKHGKGR